MTGEAGDGVLSTAQRATLAELAEVLIPGGEGMPAASAVDISGAPADRVLAQRPTASRDLPPLLERLGGAGGSADERLRALHSDDSGGFALLSSVIVGAYFLDESVRTSIGYPGQEASEPTFEDETGYLAEGLLDPVLEREPLA